MHNAKYINAKINKASVRESFHVILFLNHQIRQPPKHFDHEKGETTIKMNALFQCLTVIIGSMHLIFSGQDIS